MYKVNYQNKTRKKKKYNNKSKIYTSSIYGTRTFDSIKEANYCEELDWLLKAGEIKHYDLQYKIPIDVNGVHIANYFVDFRVIDKNDTISFHEVKGFETEVWRLKWKLCQAIKDEIEEGAEWIVIK